METCGEYKLDRAIGWGRRATFFTARAGEGGGDALIVIRRARSSERGFLQAFLRSAAEQQAAVAAGCRRLAPILAFEVDPFGFAYYATTRFEISLAEFLDAGCSVDSSLLRKIVAGVLGALSELHEKSRRAHGNLTPGNILLDSQGHIFLTDLASAGKDSTTADDLLALGTLIYQLVRRTALVGTLNPPLEYSDEWTDSLGDDAENWRELTNRLLTRTRHKGPEAIKTAFEDLRSLDRLAAKATVAPVSPSEITTSPARKAPPKKSALPKIIALILVLASVGGGGYFWWEQKEKVKREVAQKLIDAAAEEARRLALGSAIGTLQKELEEDQQALKGNNAAPAKRIIPDRILANKDTSSILDRVRRTLAQKGTTRSDVETALRNWELREKMEVRAKEWQAAPRSWERLGKELDAAAVINLDGPPALMAQFENAVNAWNSSEALEGKWTEISADLSNLAAAKNPLLPDFKDWAAGEIRAAKTVSDAPARADIVTEKIREVRKFIQGDWERVQVASFKKDAPLAQPSPERNYDWPRAWVRQAQRCLKPPRKKLDEWEAALGSAMLRISKRPKAEQPGWRQEVDKMRQRIDAALDTDTDKSEIDKLIKVFDGLKDPLEEARDAYAKFIEDWKEKDANPAIDEASAEKALGKLEKYKLDADYARQLPKEFTPIEIAKTLRAALKTEPEMKLSFGARQLDWSRIGKPDPNFAVYQLGGKNGPVVPFLPIGTTPYAMAAIETPLSLARLSGIDLKGLTKPGKGSDKDGPKIRSDEFQRLTDWRWKRLIDFLKSDAGRKEVPDGEYFVPDVKAGDLDNDTVPVTWLTFQHAKDMAEGLGGQLPKIEEWDIAKIRAGSTQRLRGRAFALQAAAVKEWAKGKKVYPNSDKGGTPLDLETALAHPSKWSFQYDPLEKTMTSLLKAGAAGDDMALWLKSVYPNGKEDGWSSTDGFYHLIGNAAEWVDDGKTGVCRGGSVVSSPNVPANHTTRSAYFDVTFRLVVKRDTGVTVVGLEKFKARAKAIGVPRAPVSP